MIFFEFFSSNAIRFFYYFHFSTGTIHVKTRNKKYNQIKTNSQKGEVQKRSKIFFHCLICLVVIMSFLFFYLLLFIIRKKGAKNWDLEGIFTEKCSKIHITPVGMQEKLKYSYSMVSLQ